MPARFDIFTRPDCPDCQAAKALLDARGYLYREHDVTREGMSDMAVYLSGSRSVPQIFLGDYYVGRLADLRSLDAAGDLSELARTLGRGTGLPLKSLRPSGDAHQSA